MPPLDFTGNEFELQAYLYTALGGLGYIVHGNVPMHDHEGNYLGAADLVVCDPHELPIRGIEVKRDKRDHEQATVQANRYAKSGLDFDVVCGWDEAKTYVEKTRQTGFDAVAFISAFRVTAFDETKALQDWLQDPRCVVSADVLHRRIYAGWNAEEAIATSTEEEHRPKAIVPRHKRSRQKPQKPYPEFPLFPHATGSWAKKIRGRMYYFGPWRDPQAALQKYLDQQHVLHAGQPRRTASKVLTIGGLCNRFLNAKLQALRERDIRQRTWDDYKTLCDRVVKALGPMFPVEQLTPQDFGAMRSSFAENRGATAVLGDINRSRILFKWAYDNGLIKEPVRYGSQFHRPSAKTLRESKIMRAERYFPADELQRLLEDAPQPLQAMLWLGINGGYGNDDVASLPIDALDLDNGWVIHPRPKTAIPRRTPLWTETTRALREVLTSPRPISSEHLVFLTSRGNSWRKGSSHSAISKEFVKWMRKKELYRPGRNFYSLRHTFQTIAEESGDFPAVQYLMGHAPAASDMAAVYRRRISDERLRRVVGVVRRWVFQTVTTSSSATSS